MEPPYADLNRLPMGTQLRLRVLFGLCGAMLLLAGFKGVAGAAAWAAAPSLSG